MKAFEERVLESAILKQRLRVRYIDDTFVARSRGVKEVLPALQLAAPVNPVHDGERYTECTIIPPFQSSNCRLQCNQDYPDPFIHKLIAAILGK